MLQNLSAWQNHIGYVPQDVYLIDDTIRKNIAFALPESRINNAALEPQLKNQN